MYHQQFDPLTFNQTTPSTTGQLSQKSKSRPSPRRQVLKISQPPLPKHYIQKAMEEQAYGNSSYENSLKSAIAMRPQDFTRALREEILDIDQFTDAELKAAYNLEQERGEGGSNSLLRYQQQISILDQSLRKLCQVTRPHSIDQANLIWKIWSSAGDLYSAVFQSLSQSIDELTVKLAEKTIAAKTWEDKYVALHGKFQRLFDAKNSSKDTELRATLRQYEEEIMLKDKEILTMQSMITNITIWFPNFVSFGDSILSRFLPPISAEQIEANKQQLLSVPGTDVDPKLRLAKDFLLQDLKRIEELSLGFVIVTPNEDVSNQPTTFGRPGGKQSTLTTVTESSAGTVTGSLKKFSSRRFSNVSANAPREDLKSLNKGLFLSSAQSSSFSVATENEYNLRSTGIRTDSTDYVEAISTLAEQIQRQQSQKLLSPQLLTANMHLRGSFREREEDDSAQIIRDLKQKLQFVLHEAQVLESQNLSLQATSKRQVFSLESELKIAQKREKQLLSKLKKAQNESNSLLTCLPSSYFAPTTFPSFGCHYLTRYHIPAAVMQEVRRHRDEDSPPLSFRYDVEEIRKLSANDADVSGLLSMEYVVSEVREILNHLLGLPGDTLDLSAATHSNGSSSSSSSSCSFLVESNAWTHSTQTNLLSGQSKHFLSFLSLNFELLYWLDDEQYEEKELEEISDADDWSKRAEKQRVREQPPPRKRFQKTMSSLFFHHVFRFFCHRHQNMLRALKATSRLFQSFLFWSISNSDSVNRTEEVKEAQWISFIGKLFFGKYFNTLPDFLQKITDQSTFTHREHTPDDSGLTLTRFQRKSEEKVNNARRFRRYYEQNEFQQRVFLDVSLRYYSSLKDFFFTGNSFPLSLLEKALLRMFSVFPDYFLATTTGRMLTSEQGPDTRQSGDRSTSGRGVMSSRLSSRVSSAVDKSARGLSGLGRVFKHRFDQHNLQEQLLHTGRLEVSVFWRFLTREHYEELFQSLLTSAQILPSETSFSEPVIDLFDSLDVIVRTISTLEKALLMVLEELYRFLISLFPNGPCDSFFGTVLHLLLTVSPVDCMSEYSSYQRHTDIPESVALAGDSQGRTSPTSMEANYDRTGQSTGSDDSHMNKRISVNLDLMNNLQTLQLSERLDASMFARVVLESCPPLLMKVFHPLMSFLSHNNYDLLFFPATDRAFQPSDRQSHTPLVLNRAVEMTSEQLLEDLRGVGGYYYDVFHALLLSSTSSEEDRRESEAETSLQSDERPVTSFLEENIEIFKALQEEEEKSSEEVTSGSSFSRAMKILCRYAKLSFDKNHRKVLPVKVTIQWFTVVTLRFCMGDLFQKIVSHDSSERADVTARERANLLSTLIDDVEEADLTQRERHSRCQRFYQLKLMRKVFRVIAQQVK